MIIIFRGSYIEASNFRNLLENNNIEVFTENDLMASIQPWAVTPGGFNPVALKVKEDDFQEAKKIINSYCK